MSSRGRAVRWLPGGGRRRRHLRVSPPSHQHPGPPAELARWPATPRPWPDRADRRRDQARLQPAHPRLAAHRPPPALVLVAAPASSQSPLVPPASPPPEASSRSMIRSRSTAALLVRQPPFGPWPGS